MRKYVLAAAIAAFAALPAANAFADASGAGCGVGAMIFDGQRGVLPQTLAVTTNGTFANQVFGISTGTLGCEQDGVVMNEHEKALYAEANLEYIKMDMAQGGGEYLDALASLMGVAEADRAALARLTQAEFAALAGADTDAALFLANLNAALAADPALARYAS